ncbi:hypothetical protein GTCCBUS3UF5_22950 [Geobacillus thermoleovorans CCB_US3_UF5]|uniref:Uncharacterized protein n=1 Tax=Geobacillus thermoleovorans CCB_US3_UF5 TaxID=1111068 RepID=A0ABM5MIR7_GEOTH|nr:hypothetical protein GTCCBUS3UF5_22950 [Geobacillus thermoleovorans CCB_US3_UF5]
MEERKWCCCGSDDSLSLIIHESTRRGKDFFCTMKRCIFYLNNIIFLNVSLL